MVAVVAGTGLGLFNTSFTQLGGASGGSPTVGQSGERHYVNLANGNLVLQDVDETILTRGLPVCCPLSAVRDHPPEHRGCGFTSSTRRNCSLTTCR